MKYPGLLVFVFLFLTAGTLFSQGQKPEWRKRLDNYKIQPVLGVQMWGTYTIGEQSFNSETGAYEAVDDRFNAQIRRTRLGFKARPTENFSFVIVAAMDLVGRDGFSGGTGGANNGALPQFGLWNAWFQWRIKKGSEALNLVGGYMPPQFGRESITSALRVTSLEKSWSQRYIRGHLTGTNPGRALGFNLGGLLRSENSPVALSYDAGIFNPVSQAFSGNSTGRKNAPLLVGRVALHLGDPEFEKYTISHKINYMGQRKGLTLAVQGAAEGETDLFKANYAAGADLLFNWGNFNLDGEYAWMIREGVAEQEGLPARTFTTHSGAGHIRASYNIPVLGHYFLEPMVMLMQFSGEMEADKQADALRVKTPSGEESLWDAGVNFYIDPDFIVSLHYSHRMGDAGDAGPGATVNDYFYQKETGAIHRGDWVGAGLLVVF